MAQRTPPTRPASTRGRSRKPAPVKKPFPWGFLAGCTALAVLLVGIIVYAVQNQGVGDTSSLKYADNSISGLHKTDGLSRNHKTGTLTYPGSATAPPVGGDHNVVPESCQVYAAQIPNEHALHSLEHGAVWVTYNPKTVKPADIAKLKTKVDGNPYRLMSLYPGLKSPISLQAWGRQVFVKSADDSRVDAFLKVFTSGPQAPERTAQCTGTTTTGKAPAAAGGTTPTMPSPAASQ